MRALVVLALVLASCGSARPRRRDPAIASQAPTRRASASTHVTPDPAPVTEPAIATSADTRPAIDVIEGRVSYYADSLAGHSTATGEPYDPTDLTAASRDLPFGTIVRVVRIDTGATVVVRINDRGPFGRRTRILDLSRAAAEALDMIRAGVIDARAEILERGPARH
jgi:rare lipoprotein A